MRAKLTLRQWLLSICLILILSPVYSSEIEVPPARDLQADAAEMQAKRLPMLLIVSQSDCGYCLKLKQTIIRPMLSSGLYNDKVIIRELLMDDFEAVTDFDGSQLTGSQLAQHYQEWLTPTVLLLDFHGRELVERIRGINNVDYYGYYLDKAIEKAGRLLQNSGS